MEKYKVWITDYYGRCIGTSKVFNTEEAAKEHLRKEYKKCMDEHIDYYTREGGRTFDYGINKINK